MEYEFIKEKVSNIKAGSKQKYAVIVDEWLLTDNKTLKFKCANETEKKNCAWAVEAYKRAHNLDYTVFRERSTYNIYLVKA